ncbi:hypothetical protein HYY74_02040 [Candidatus Woesearchaeota archaeon]|nr:hypothetical protein [Candidatus Woesearchaeota archaeon]
MKAMNMDVHRAGMSLAATLGALYAVCLFAVLVLPPAAMQFIASSLFHAFDVSRLMTSGVTVAQAIAGAVITLAGGYLLGAVHAFAYGRLGR